MKIPPCLPRRLIASAVAQGCLFTCPLCHAADYKTPVIQEPWVQVAGDPDLAELTSTNQQPVDFAVWQAADGTWQLWSCIRGTKEPGHTRLLYSWEGKSLTEPNWTPKGIVMHADPKYGEGLGYLQAPYVFRDDTGRFVMFYGNGNGICSAESPANDGKNFTRILDAQGKSMLFTDGGGTRDPMVIQINHVWYCYSTAGPMKVGSVYCGTSRDLVHWSPSTVVNTGGQGGTGAFSAECPFVVELNPGEFYLFRNQIYGRKAQNSVYFSKNPFDFGVNNDIGHFVCRLPIAAPEIIQYEGQYFIAALLPSLKGIQIARLAWTP